MSLLDLLSAFVLINTAMSTNILRREGNLVIRVITQQTTGNWLAGSALAYGALPAF